MSNIWEIESDYTGNMRVPLEYYNLTTLKRNCNKRKRLTSAFRSYLPSWSEPVDQNNNEETIRQLQLKVERLETEKRDLSQQVERSTIAHDLSLKDSLQKIAKLTSERNITEHWLTCIKKAQPGQPRLWRQ
ncbi:uncharacterized protein EV154DRAFT_550156 [Mucor mucedo]|uniref:uncharacterized protein n=1 Tax=Mucor mucedo TaxID=29922 RepID=UPI00221EC8A6|nr:uncharacterized protein EV154DRAFT_550156 [Mucor mucedo]KAI7893191.1 hypothetical protein EV154DRAFT_550156 [Mucor mucedo]